MIKLVPLNLRDCTFVAANMRSRDWEECSCQIMEESKRNLGVDMYTYTPEGYGFSVWLQDQPIVCVGVVPTSVPTLCHAWMFGTGRTRRVVPFLTRYIVTEYIPFLLKMGVLRVEVRCLASHIKTQDWFVKMGAAFDCRLHNFGKDGEDFIQFSWWKDMFDAEYLRSRYPGIWGSNADIPVDGLTRVEERVGCKVDPVVDGGRLHINGGGVDLRV